MKWGEAHFLKHEKKL